MKPKVSVITSVYNHEKYIEEAVRSVLNQTMPDLEMIIIDDGSTDKSYEICQKLQNNDQRIRLKRQENQGQAKARNEGIKMANGEYLAVLDSDDFMDARALELQLKEFSLDESYDVIYTAINVVNDNKEIVKAVRENEEKQENFLAKMFFRNIMPNPHAILAKIKCFKNNLYDEKFICAEDYSLMLILAHKYRFHYLDLPLRFYRRHKTNMSNDLKKQRDGELKVLRFFDFDHILQVIRSFSLDDDEKKLLIAKVLYNLEEFDRAILHLQKLESLATVNFYLGNCYYKKNNIDRAIEYYNKSLTLDSKNPACLNNLGVANAKASNLPLAKECFEEALKLKEGYLDPKLNLKNIKHADNFTFRELRVDVMPY